MRNNKSLLCFIMLLCFVSLSACNSYEDYWVLEKSRYNEVPEMVDYFPKRAQENPSRVGYSTYTISEGRKMIALVVGSQHKGSEIEVTKFQEKGNTTYVTVNIKKGKSNEENPVILIGVSKLHKNIVIQDTDGNKYEKL
ncbi:hypothetical protein SAMN04488168_11840 [Bacillus sp. 491mf]|uniref:hypothetical protein n=1 Tax=Bacillus TaxID=1386 RepID=UPI0008EFDAE7|nr:hypothetical protein [Bacillus sp. 491mf]SFD10514.1 hypothetical protein SAMN04488168_11840 [Bacillus sp. 491mf]